MLLHQYVNQKFNGKTPSQLIGFTVLGCVSVKLCVDFLWKGQLTTRARLGVHQVLRFIAAPLINRKIKETGKTMTMPSMKKEYKAIKLPEEGLTYQEVLGLMEGFHESLDLSWNTGGFSGTVYHGGKAHTDFINEVMTLFQWSNPLHSDVFGATRKMEAEVVSMVLHMFNGHLLPDFCGAVTSGGTESIMMAMRVYKEWGRATKGLSTVSVIIGITAHPAFDKAAEYFDLELIKIPVNDKTKQVDVSEMEKYIKYNTVAIVGSAPTFPHGVIDPIPELSELALRYQIGLHVDCCLGGFIVPFLEKAGWPAPVVDFRNKGVTSISCDTHKYGYAPKGTSTVLYRSKKLRSYQFCCVADWPGGVYCSPAVSGSKAGNVIAATWAAMVHMGENGYVEHVTKIMEATDKMVAAIEKLPYFHLIGKPGASVFAFGSEVLDIFKVGDELRKHNWILNSLQYPSGLQFSVTVVVTKPGSAEKFIQCLTDIGDELYKEAQAEQKKGIFRRKNQAATMYATQQRVSDRSIIKDILKEFLNQYYSTHH